MVVCLDTDFYFSARVTNSKQEEMQKKFHQLGLSSFNQQGKFKRFMN